MIYKARIKFDSDCELDDEQIYTLMGCLCGQFENVIYIEIEDEEGEEIGYGVAGEDAK